MSQFNHDLIRAVWIQLLSTNSVNQQLNVFSIIFCEILQKHAPEKIAFVRNRLNFETKNESWFGESCRAALDEKQEAHREYQRNPHANRLRRYGVQQRSLKANTERCHKQYNQTLFEFLKSTKDRWKFINNIRKPMKVSDIKILNT